MKPKTTLEIWRENEYKKLSLRRLKGRTILDVGCGNGDVTYYLSKIAKNVVGVDIAVHSSWKKYIARNLKYVRGNAEKLPFKDNSFDGIFLQDVLHHVNNPLKVLGEINRVTKRDSIIFLVEANRYNPLFYFHMTKIRGHEHLSEKDFRSLVLKVFTNVEFSTHESHFIPYFGVDMCLKISKFFELIFELPVLRNFKAYNFALVKK